MNRILEKIITNKRKEILQRKAETPLDKLERSPYFNREPVSLKKSLKGKKSSGIIAEFKRMSPSAGWIKRNADPVAITKAYVSGGAAALSVLTDRVFFSGTRDDLMRAREVNECPILRKDFIIDPYQVSAAKAIGADAILLIAAILDNTGIRELAKQAHDMGLEVLMEVHEESELSCLNKWIDLVGVNNRNLKKMETDINASIELASHIPDEYLKISESGISDPGTIMHLRELGYRGFLIGEHFMRHNKPGKACRKLIEKLD